MVKNALSASVMAFIAFMGCLLLAFASFPANALSQENTPDDTESTATTSAETETAEAEETAETSPAKKVIVDNYKRERLPGNAVFSDFVVGPGRFDLSVAPGESKTVEMVVTNRMGVSKVFSLTTEDMVGNDGTEGAGAVSLLGEEVGPYTIKDYISVPHEKFILQHGERARIPVTVSLPADAEPGGFYGSLLTQIISDEVPQPNTNVAPGSKVVSRIGTLFFVTTPGDIERSLNLQEFATLGRQKFFNSGPVTFNIVTENTGSVHTTPFGELRIFNTFGNEVGFVELPPWYVLPQSFRNREVRWDREFLVGQYTAELQLNHGYDGEVTTTTYTFWVIPIKLVGVIFLGLFVFFMLIRFFFSQFEFKRKRR